ncbi:hypothetical protein [Catellatospora citrea]|uniref:DUF5666 domain-containing protein n=1 Tax=Catellatospora citrea TaxID=53366 RepID=A0A8J3KE67_9ACTN|nr:hypothetical protein [Catellatospora citrea]RKE08728.1 hypothetical protein C8E86_3593 [Catellatospora citrea]GIG01557.1 hypothetical protein Cci01nite_66500 [Catellatospora citrea]
MRKLSLTVALGLTALLGLTACGPSDMPAAATGLVASVEAEALAAMGVAPVDLVAAESDLDATASPAPAAKDKIDNRLQNWRKRHALRVALRRDVQHGEAVVETKKGPVTVLVQRGVVTAVDGDSITVKSADGYTQTWHYGEKLRVVEKRATIQATELKAGAQVALAGPKEGDVPTARLIVIPLAR